MIVRIYEILFDSLITCFETGCFFLLLANEEEKSRVKKVRFYIIIVSQALFCTYLDWNVWAKFLIFEIIVVLFGKRYYKCNAKNLFIYGIIYIFLLDVSEIIAIQSWDLLGRTVYTSTTSINSAFEFTLSVILMAKALMLFFSFVVEKIISGIKGIEKFKDGLPIIISSFSFVAVLECLYLIMPQVEKAKDKLMIIICIICILVAFISNVIFTNQYVLTQRRKREEEIALSQLEMKNEYYLKRLEEEEKVKEIYHDLKNFFLVTESSAINKTISEKLKKYGSYYETGNIFLNIVLADKISKAEKFGITIECNVDFSKGSFMQPLEITTLFGNLLDNAIEACEKVDIEERYIIFKSQCKGGFQSIVIKNSMRYFDNTIKTAKNNKAFHGYGLVNVKRVIQIYNGHLSIDAHDNEFMISIIIPIPDDSIGGKDEE